VAVAGDRFQTQTFPVLPVSPYLPVKLGEPFRYFLRGRVAVSQVVTQPVQVPVLDAMNLKLVTVNRISPTGGQMDETGIVFDEPTVSSFLNVYQ